MNKRYIVEHGLPKTVSEVVASLSGCETVEDLTRYLEKNPYPKYRLVNCQWISGTYQLVWELI